MSMLKKKLNLRKIMPRGRAMFLAYDQGMEHGPTDFNDENADPIFIIDIAKKGKFTGQIYQKGIAEKYHEEIMESKVPLIIKLNGKSSMVQGEPVSRQLCTVGEAKLLGAKAVGYTIYLGSAHEDVMFREFVQIQRDAHSMGLPVIAWMYPRGKGARGKKEKVTLAYAARVGLELGADIVKIHWKGRKEDLAWAIRNAGKTKVVIAGGKKSGEKILLNDVKSAMKVGASGLAIGRNIWQSKEPVKLAKKLRKLVW